ncbi:MAG: hypothetical protein IT374_00025 [Polyangiaceae bacterium]|nr:hypothetical protein [Polyangiaceae bacterium]
MIINVSFASYGTPKDQCPGLEVVPACNDADSRAVVEGLCLGQRSCSVPATSLASSSGPTFGTDPCPGQIKTLAASVECGAAPSTVDVPNPAWILVAAAGGERPSVLAFKVAHDGSFSDPTVLVDTPQDAGDTFAFRSISASWSPPSSAFGLPDELLVLIASASSPGASVDLSLVRSTRDLSRVQQTTLRTGIPLSSMALAARPSTPSGAKVSGAHALAAWAYESDGRGTLQVRPIGCLSP